MSQIQDAQGFIDTIKERISNPAIFTFMCSWCICNWQILGWFLFEPLRFSLKLKGYENYGYSFELENAIWVWLAIVILSPFVNNSVDFILRAWDQLFNIVLKSINWKELVEASKYNNELKRADNLEIEQRKNKREIDALLDEKQTLEKDNSDKASAINKLNEQSVELEKEKNNLLNELKTLKNDLKLSDRKKEQAEKQLNENIENYNSQRAALDSEYAKLKSQHKLELERLKSEHNRELNSLKTENFEISKKFNKFKNQFTIEQPKQIDSHSIKDKNTKFAIKSITVGDKKISSSDTNEQGVYSKPIFLEGEKMYKFPIDVDYSLLSPQDKIVYYDGKKLVTLNPSSEFIEFPFGQKQQSIRLMHKGINSFGDERERQKIQINFKEVEAA